MHPTAEHTRAERPASSLPPMVAIPAFRTPIRGYAFASPPPGGERPVTGLPAELAREPDNPADPLAVAVWASPASGARWRIGYLDRGVAARVAPRLDAGRRVRAQLDGWSSEPEGRWRRPLLLLLPDDEEAAGGEEPAPASGSESESGPTLEPPSPTPALGPAPEPEPDPEPEAERAPEPAREVAAAPASNVTAIDDVPRIWGRPPGVRRRRVS